MPCAGASRSHIARAKSGTDAWPCSSGMTSLRVMLMNRLQRGTRPKNPRNPGSACYRSTKTPDRAPDLDAWTVNAPENMARLIDWGVDGLITDYPDRARAVMAAKGLPLPPPVALR